MKVRVYLGIVQTRFKSDFLSDFESRKKMFSKKVILRLKAIIEKCVVCFLGYHFNVLYYYFFG